MDNELDSNHNSENNNSENDNDNDSEDEQNGQQETETAVNSIINSFNARPGFNLKSSLKSISNNKNRSDKKMKLDTNNNEEDSDNDADMDQNKLIREAELEESNSDSSNTDNFEINIFNNNKNNHLANNANNSHDTNKNKVDENGENKNEKKSELDSKYIFSNEDGNKKENNDSKYIFSNKDGNKKENDSKMQIIDKNNKNQDKNNKNKNQDKIEYETFKNEMLKKRHLEFHVLFDIEKETFEQVRQQLLCSDPKHLVETEDKYEKVCSLIQYWYCAITYEGRSTLRESLFSRGFLTNEKQEILQKKEDIPPWTPAECSELLFGDLKMDISSIASRWQEYATLLTQFKMFLESSAISHQTMLTTIQKLDHVYKSISASFSSLISEYSFYHGNLHPIMTYGPSLRDTLNVDHQNERDLLKSEESFKSDGEFIVCIYKLAKKLGLVRIDGRVYEKVYTKNKMSTHSYKLFNYKNMVEDGDMEQFIYASFYLTGQPDHDLRTRLYHNLNKLKALVMHLDKIQEDRFPLLTQSRYHFEFENGIYGSENDCFYPREQILYEQLPSSIVCCRYFDQDFDDIKYQWELLKDPEKNWMNIECPLIDTIPNIQDWDDDTKRWWYIGIGRALFPANKFESWQKLWLHIGRGGAGKTSTLRIAMEFFPAERVSVLSDNCETVFGLQSFERTWAWFALDISSNIKMSLAVINNMIDNYKIAMARKFQKALYKNFTQHGNAAMNALPKSWTDTGGSLRRRLIVLLYKKIPDSKVCNIHLIKNLHETTQIGAALKKCVSAYHWAVRRYGDKNLDENVLPQSMIRDLNTVLSEIDILQGFLDNSMEVQFDSKAITTWEAFMKTFHAYIHYSKKIEEFRNPDSILFRDVWKHKSLDTTSIRNRAQFFYTLEQEVGKLVANASITHDKGAKSLQEWKASTLKINPQYGIIKGMRLLSGNKHEDPVVCAINDFFLKA